MKYVLSVIALAVAVLFTPMAISTAAFAQPSPTCFTKALNGDVIDPPMCFVAQAHKANAAQPPAPAAPLPPCVPGDNPSGCHL